MGTGRLVTIEGLDGAGKSTLARSLVEELTARGHPAELIREPGGVEVSERIRALLVDPALPVTARAEALLYAAARAQLVEQLLEPRLAAGAVLVLDRFVDSSLAYQGAGRGLGVEQIALLNRFATGPLQADRTLLLELPRPPPGPAGKTTTPRRTDSSSRDPGSSRRSPAPTGSSPHSNQRGSARSTPPARPARS